MKSYKDLDIYKIAHVLAVELHKMTLQGLPKFEMYEEGSQIRRSSKSIVSTIVEGFGRKAYQQEFIRYLTYAIASCDETKEHLELLVDTNSFKDKNKFDNWMKELESLGRKLFNFRRTVAKDLE
ncbi:MAG: four helix bundle protein [Candidatus Omnitrophica bacterium]|nr:four helix bundle protein [Candidatus Omnitrophota bacterium]